MRGKLAEGNDFRVDDHFLAEKAQGFRAFLQRATASTLGLKACEDDGIARVGQTLGEVMQNTAAGDHATGGYDDAGGLDVVNLLGFVGGASEMELMYVERIAFAVVIDAGEFEIVIPGILQI